MECHRRVCHLKDHGVSFRRMFSEGKGHHGCCWETFCIFAHCGLVVEIQPLNC